LMYTSCGWFFDHLDGLEPVQNLKYAALSLRYFRQLGGGAPETELLRRLEAAPASPSPYGDGAGVYRRFVLPAVVGLRRVVVGYARMKADLLARYGRHSMAEVVHGLDEHFPGKTFSLRDLFLEDRRGVLGRVVRAVLLRHEETYHRVWEESRALVHYLREVDA